MADCLIVCLQQDHDGQHLQGQADLHVQPRCMGEGGGVGRFSRFQQLQSGILQVKLQPQHQALHHVLDSRQLGGSSRRIRRSHLWHYRYFKLHISFLTYSQCRCYDRSPQLVFRQWSPGNAVPTRIPTTGDYRWRHSLNALGMLSTESHLRWSVKRKEGLSKSTKNLHSAL